MNIIIQSIHFTATDELKAFVTEKVNKLEHYYDKIESASVYLKLEKSDTHENKVCEIRLAVPGNDLFATSQSETFEKAAGESVTALHSQIDKIK